MKPPWTSPDFTVAPRLDAGRRTSPPRPRLALLINPFYRKDPRASFGKHVLTPSLALTSIAAATPPDWETRLWDENLLGGPPPCEPFPRVVGITVHLTFAARAYELSAWYRERGATVVLGGPHVQSCPEEAAPHADAIAVGEGTGLWPLILTDVAEDRLQPVYRGDFTAPFRLEPAPRRSLLPRHAFLTTASITTSRGCRGRCDFCWLSTEGLRMPYQVRDAEQVVAEILQERQPYVVFTDNNLGASPPHLRSLCRALRPLEIIWSAAVSLDVTDDPTLVREMALSGCTGVFIGFESLTDVNLRSARKRAPGAREYAGRVRLLHEHGIQVNGSFVFGFDHDRPDVFDRTVRWIEDQRLECATFHILTPYPGTPLFRSLERQGRILHRDWSRYDTAHAVFQPRHLSPDELEAGYGASYRKLFSHRSIWARRPADPRAVAPYLAMSYLYKRSNRMWALLIRHRLTARVWRPLIEVSRLRHLRFRKALDEAPVRRHAWSFTPAGT